MVVIDRYAYQNRLRTVHPGEKALFAVAALVLCLTARSPLVWGVVFLLMVGLLVYGAGVPWRVVGRLMKAPTSFLLIGGATIALSFTTGSVPTSLPGHVELGGLTVGITPGGFSTAGVLLGRSFAALSCLYFLSLTTPMVEIVWVCRKLRFPALLLELMTLIYRFIFVMLAAAETVHRAQDSRLGYSTSRRAFRSLARLISILFGKAYRDSQALHLAMLARGYEGEFRVLDPPWRISLRNVLAIAATLSAIFLIAVLSGGVGVVGVHP